MLFDAIHKLLLINSRIAFFTFVKHVTTFLYSYGYIIFVYYVNYDSWRATDNSMFCSTHMHTRIMQGADALLHDEGG